ncbi:Rv3212 family protein [Streptoalloteichus hindustanus]|uniref:PQQ-like domain-containing protein n=1 Tax=Streptoalloteichus hindustanus TaxID=2017 RepID=A0A1M5J6D5_STRHI|nr:PQQ-binding-like beta-propeller repeat protein [Streptoalloteichus hindustanus]SHG36186.1 PQQ-like domain-containing protein [Streptoalloteichus hindustanus]
MVRPERRKKSDLVAVALLAVGVLVAGTVVWWGSDARATSSRTAPSGPVAPEAPTSVPPSLAELWRAPSGATTSPVVVGPTVVTAHGGEVVGHDPLTGDVRWRYSRDLDLCTVGAAWDRALAVYRKSRNCSEVTALDGTTGERAAQRNTDAELGTRLLSDGVHVTATGGELVEVWRSDLVRTLQYGEVPAIVNPNKQPRPECSYGSFAVASNRIGVVEHCPAEQTDRFTVLRPNPKESDQPEQLWTTLTAGKNARVVAMSGELVAVALPHPARLTILDSGGRQIAEHPLPVPDSELTGDPAGRVVPTTMGTSAIYWFTGSRTVALAPTDLRPLWTVENTLGTGTVLAGRLVLPVPGGLAVHDAASGARLGVLPVDRAGHTGPVSVTSLGPVLVEQRGDTVVALR